VLELADIHTYYGNIRALRGISFEVKGGEIVTLIGANGAGKTTTLKTVIGLLKPRQGTITLSGQRIDGLPPDRIVRLDTKTGQATEYLMPHETNLRRVHVDNRTTPVTFWVGNNHFPSVVKVEPLD